MPKAGYQLGREASGPTQGPVPPHRLPAPSHLLSFILVLLATIQLEAAFLSCSKKRSHSVVSDSLRPHGLQPTRLLRPWDLPSKSTGVGCHFLLQGIFPTQGSNSGLPHCRQTLYCLSHQRSPHFFKSDHILPSSETWHKRFPLLACLSLARSCFAQTSPAGGHVNRARLGTALSPTVPRG